MHLIIFSILCFLLVYLPLDFGGHSPRSQLIFIIITFLLFAGALPLHKNDNTKKLFLPFILFSAALILSLLFSTSFYFSLIQVLLFISYFLIFIIISAVYKDSYYNKFNLILSFSVMLVAFLGLYFYKITNFAGFESDLYSTFYQKNICAGFFVLTLPVMLNLFLNETNKITYIYFGFASYLSLLGLLFTQSRWSWLIFVPMFLFIVFINYKNSENKKMFFKRLIILLLLFLFSIQVFSVKKNQEEKFIPPFVKERISTITQIDDASKSARGEFYLIALKMFKDHPLTGVGPANYGYYYASYEKAPRYYSKFVHNFYLQILCEQGIFGFIFFMLILFLIIREYIKVFNLSKNTKYFPFISGLVLGCFGVLIHIMVHLDWLFAAPPFYFWLFSGILFYYSNFLSNNNAEKASQISHTNKNNAGYYLASIILIVISAVVVCFYLANIYQENAEYYKNKGDFKYAFYYYEKAIRLNPLNPDYHRQIAGLYFYAPNIISLNDAIEEAKMAIKREKLKPNNYILLAKLYKERHNDKLYIDTLEKVLRIDWINYPSVYNDLAAYYIEKNDIKKSRFYLLKIIPLYKDEYFIVMPDFRRAELKKQISNSYVLLAGTYLMENNKKSALFYIEKAKQINNIK